MFPIPNIYKVKKSITKKVTVF